MIADIYDAIAEDYEQSTDGFLRSNLKNDANIFIKDINENKKILDIGSGPGRDAQYFACHGLEPICIDISPEMIKRCKEKGLKAILMDMENMGFNDNEFHGIWAYTSLFHIPKARMPKMLAEVKRVLAPNGLFYLGMKEGDNEGEIVHPKYKVNLYYSLYREEKLRTLLEPNFEIIRFSRVYPDNGNRYLNFMCRAKPKV